MQFDDLIEKLHGFGRHQWVVVVLSGLVFYPISFNHMFPILGAASPNFRCSLDPSFNISDVQSALRSNNASDSIDQCSVPVVNNRTGISEDVVCEQWTYDKTKVGSTIVTQVTVFYIYLSSKDKNLYRVFLNLYSLFRHYSSEHETDLKH